MFVFQVSYEALKKRYDQGWILEMIDNLDQLIDRIKTARQNREVASGRILHCPNCELIIDRNENDFALGDKYRFPWQRRQHLGKISRRI